MERLKLQYEIAHKALNALQQSLHVFLQAHQNTDVDDIHMEIYRDSLIKRFEFTLDVTWKYLKRYIAEKHGLDIVSPKKIFRECLTLKIISAQESEELLNAVDDRNDTSHRYDENIADQISNKIENYYTIFDTIITRTKPKL